jgi:hypothetical protein
MSDEEIVWEAPPDPKNLPPALWLSRLLAAVQSKPGLGDPQRPVGPM